MINKKITNVLVIVSLLLLLIYTTLFYLQNVFLKKSYRKEYIPLNAAGLVKSVLVRCNYNVLNPEIADLYLTTGSNYIDLSFHSPEKLFSLSKLDWRNSLNGSTRIYNLSFSQALQMLKKDCSQFKQDYNYEETYGDFERQKNEVYWKYSRKTNLDDINIVEEGKEAVTNETETKIDKEWLEQNLKEYGFDNNEIKDILNKE